MRFFAGLLGFCLLVVLSNANVVQRRTNRNTEEILVPVAIIQDDKEIPELAKLKENETEAGIKTLQSEEIAENLVAAVEEIEAEAEAVPHRRIDEAILEEEIKEAIKEDQIKEAEKITDKADQLSTTLAEIPEISSVIANEDPGLTQEPAEQTEKAIAQNPEQVLLIVEDSESANNADEESQKPAVLVRQATQATPTQTTTQQNFVQQFIQSSPLGQFFNQLTGQAPQTQVASDNTAAAPAPTLPGLFNPVAAVQNAAQSVVNSTTQAFQGLQQFASNLGNQFQNTLSGLGGQQQQDQSVTTVRPPGPIQQLVNTFLPQQAQPAPTQQGPLQGFLNIFQGNNRPQQAGNVAATAISDTQPAKEPEIQEQTQAAVPAETTDQANNEVRDSAEANDSFEESIQPEELIIVRDANDTENDAEQEAANN